MKFRTPRTLRATLEQVSRIRHDAHLALWSVIVILFPFYFFDSGLPQPGDLLTLMLLVILVRSWNGRLPPGLAKSLKALLLFVIYVLVVNVAWSFAVLTFTLNAKEGFLLAPTLYIFNGLVLFTFMLMFQRYGEFLLWLTVRLVLASVLVQLLIAAILRPTIGRSTL